MINQASPLLRSYARTEWVSRLAWLAHVSWVSPRKWLALRSWVSQKKWLALTKWASRKHWLALTSWVSSRIWLALLVWVFLPMWLAQQAWVSPRAWLARVSWRSQYTWLAQGCWVSRRLWLASLVWVSPALWLAQLFWMSLSVWLAPRIWVSLRARLIDSSLSFFEQLVEQDRLKRINQREGELADQRLKVLNLRGIANYRVPSVSLVVNTPRVIGHIFLSVQPGSSRLIPASPLPRLRLIIVGFSDAMARSYTLVVSYALAFSPFPLLLSFKSRSNFASAALARSPISRATSAVTIKVL